MDMTEFAKAKEGRLQKHTKAIRDNKISVALMMLYLEGYDVELHYRGHPLADLAQEALDELGYDGIDIWSCSTRDGGIWETWERAALKTGTLDEWEKFRARNRI